MMMQYGLSKDEWYHLPPKMYAPLKLRAYATQQYDTTSFLSTQARQPMGRTAGGDDTDAFIETHQRIQEKVGAGKPIPVARVIQEMMNSG